MTTFTAAVYVDYFARYEKTWTGTVEEAVKLGFNLDFPNDHTHLVSVKAQFSTGHYEYCHRTFHHQPSGWHLTSPSDKDSQVVVHLTITLPPKLVRQIDSIMIRDLDGVSLVYTAQPIPKEQVLRSTFLLDPKRCHIESMIVYLGKYLPLPPNRWRGQPPDLQIFGRVVVPLQHQELNEDCPICLDKVESNKYVSTCRHVFHHSCLWSYLKQDKSLFSKCTSTACDHAAYKARPFPCPMCRTTLEDYQDRNMWWY